MDGLKNGKIPHTSVSDEILILTVVLFLDTRYKRANKQCLPCSAYKSNDGRKGLDFFDPFPSFDCK